MSKLLCPIFKDFARNFHISALVPPSPPIVYTVAQWFPTGEEFLPGEKFHEFRRGISTL